MNTRLLMRASAALLVALGLAATFMPEEILGRFGAAPVGAGVVLVQLAGALYLGFAFLDWMTQGNLIGGIYGRPVAIANFSHFMIGALALAKAVVAGARAPEMMVGAAVYGLFAVAFAFVAFTHPAAVADAEK